MSLPDPQILLIIGGICALVGFALGGLVTSLLGGRGTKDDPGPGLHLSRDPQTGELRLHLDGQALARPQGLPDRQFDRVSELVAAASRWLTPVGTPAASAAAASLAPSAPPVAPPAPAASTPPPTPSGLVGVFARAVNAEIKPPAAAPRSIAAEVDEILQELLAARPAAPDGPARPIIRLQEIPGRGLVVQVGQEQYEGVDAVPDPAIKALLRQAVQRWEARRAG